VLEFIRADYSGTQTYSDPILVEADINNTVNISVGGSAILLPLEGFQATVSGLIARFRRKPASLRN